jgi:hypothetical protein
VLAKGEALMHFIPTISFDPDTLKVLQTAYDEACLWLTTTQGFVSDDESRKALAVRIVEYAKRGERDLEKLRVYALAGVY